MSKNILGAKNNYSKVVGASAVSAGYWRAATIVLFITIVFIFFFDIEIESKFGSANSPETNTSAVSTQGVQRAPSTRNIPAPRGGGGCGV